MTKHNAFQRLTALTLVTLLPLLAINLPAAETAATNNNAKPALTVSVAKPQQEQFIATLSANGNIAAWQEAIISTEVNGLRLDEILVNVGDNVKRGQVLATFATDTITAEIEQIQAAIAEAEAYNAEAQLNAQRAREVGNSGALSAQKIDQLLTASKTAKAKLQAQQAALKIQQLRLSKTKILAPDNGVISARTATLGAVLGNGQELFRLLRQNRLEWRAEVTAAELKQIHSGMAVDILSTDNTSIQGKVRSIAPTVDTQSRLGIVYVDMPHNNSLKAGMYSKGEFHLGSYQAITIPQQALVARDGFNYIFTVDRQNHVSQKKVQAGRHHADRIEIQTGLTLDDTIVVGGAGFLNHGDLVQITPITPSAAMQKP